MMLLGPLGGPRGGSLPAWTPVLSTDQGTAPFDPGALAGAGTVFDPATGLFTFVFNATTPAQTVVDGYRENQVCWTKRVLDLHPTYDADFDILQVAIEFIALPPLSASDERYGISFGLLDCGTATKVSATCNGSMQGVHALSPTQYQGFGLNETIFGSTGSVGTTPELGHATFLRGGVLNTVTREMTRDWWLRGSGSSHYIVGQRDGVDQFDLITGNWRLCIGHTKKNTTVTAGSTFRAKLWTRHIPTTALVGLPAGAPWP